MRREQESPINFLKQQGADPLPVGPETNEDVRQMLDGELEEGEGALQITAPYGQEKVSASRTARASYNKLDERSVEKAVRELAPEVDDLKLVVTGPGGRIDSGNKIARSIDNNFDSIETYVPHFAKSMATLVSLTGDQIVMGEMSDIGPLDPQIPDSDGTRYSAKDLVNAYDRVRTNWNTLHPQDASAPERSMMERMDVLEYEEAKRSMDAVKKYAFDLLSEKDGVSEEEAQASAEGLVEGLPVHGYTLTREEASEILPEGMVVSEDDRSDEMGVMRDWMDMYAFDNCGEHVVVYHS